MSTNCPSTKKWNSVRPIVEVDVEGTPQQIGETVGELLKDKIKRNIDILLNELKARLNLEKDEVLKDTQKFLPAMEEYAPDLVEEMKAITTGSGVNFEEILFLNVAMDLFMMKETQLGLGCTSFAATGPATLNGETLIGQNMDWIPTINEFVVERIVPEIGSQILMVTLAGTVGFVGINSTGLTCNMNSLLTAETQFRVPIGFIVRKVLQQKKIGDSISAILKAKRSASLNYVLANSDGDILNIETSPIAYNVIMPSNYFLTHSNHFLTEWLKREDLHGPVEPSTYIREYRARIRMEENWGKLTKNVMINILKDHHNFPDSICRHVDEDDPIALRYRTTMSMVSKPEDLTTHICLGSPCQATYADYRAYRL